MPAAITPRCCLTCACQGRTSAAAGRSTSPSAGRERVMPMPPPPPRMDGAGRRTEEATASPEEAIMGQSVEELEQRVAALEQKLDEVNKGYYADIVALRRQVEQLARRLDALQ